jgi:hypothetical protein
MQKKSEDFSVQEAMRLAKSPAGQQLIAMLRRSDKGQLQQVIDQASAGDFSKAGQMLNTMLSSKEAKALLQKLEEQ